MGFGKMHCHGPKAGLLSTEANSGAVFRGSFVGTEAHWVMLLQCPTSAFLCDHSYKQVYFHRNRAHITLEGLSDSPRTNYRDDRGPDLLGFHCGTVIAIYSWWHWRTWSGWMPNCLKRFQHIEPACFHPNFPGQSLAVPSLTNWMFDWLTQSIKNAYKEF